MWDLPRLALLQKARHALRDGRLDEAYAIVTSPEVGDHRQVQILLEKLVAPLLERARTHLAGGRFEDALADVERAHRAGGNRPQTAELREEVLRAMRAKRREREQGERLRASVLRHLEEGRLAEAAARLAEQGDGAGEAGELARRVERLQAEASRARERARRHLEAGDVTAALDALLEVRAAREDAESRELLLEIGRRGREEIRERLEKGALAEADRLFQRLQAASALGVDGPSPAAALELCRRAAKAAGRGDWHEARAVLGRLEEELPGARWAAEAASDALRAEEALGRLRAGPLGQGLSPGAPGVSSAETLAVPDLRALGTLRGPSPLKREDPSGSPRGSGAGRYLLWVDGVGSFLLLLGDRVTLGRAGSSAAPDVALAADLEGIHAEILRIDHDYFLVPRGPAAVGGRPVERHLLAAGDEILLGARSRLKFLLPTNLSPTAILELGSGLRLAGDVRKVILVDGHVILGPGEDCHVPVPQAGGRIVLSATGSGFRCRAPQPIVRDGVPAGTEEVLPAGAHVEAGSFSFTLTEADRGGRQR